MIKGIINTTLIVIVLLLLNCINHRETVIISKELGFIDKKYYELDSVSVKLKNLNGLFNEKVNYPQMYRFLLESDFGIKPFEKGFIFIDPKTEIIKIDTLFNFCPIYNYGDTNQEYRYKFIPYIYDKSIEDCTRIIENLAFERESDDVRLNNYIIENPNSYVALWHLIERVNYIGYSKTRNIALNNFSQELKSTKIWMLLRQDLIRLKKFSLGQVLPPILIKDSTFNENHFDFSKLKKDYTLVEFWFSRCKPCHAKFEKLIPLYEKYQSQGFEILNISTDDTNEISLWLNYLKKYHFEWPNYLDENGIEATNMNIDSYPYSFLLNKNGKILLINPSTKELTSYLEKNI